MLPPARKALYLRFGEQNFHTIDGRYMQFRRRPGRLFCSPLPTKPYAFVSRSKIFTQLPAVKRIFARTAAGLFAPPCPQSLMPSFRGAKSSHNCRPLSAFSPAYRPASLLPPARKALCLRFGEQNLHTIAGRYMQFYRQTRRPLCSPLPANPCIFVSGSKIFTQLPAATCNFAGGRAGD